MPIFEYKCPGCGAKREVLASFSASESMVMMCVCGCVMERIISPPGYMEIKGKSRVFQKALTRPNRKR